jgi:hypothetical protein
MISKQNRALSITYRGIKLYENFNKYSIVNNLKIHDKLTNICVYNDNERMFSANMYYSYYVILHLIDEKFKRRRT